MTVSFEKSAENRRANSQKWAVSDIIHFEQKHLRDDKPLLPELGELEVLRHFTKLSQKNFSIDTQFYPLGSCTMKYNPRIALKCAFNPSVLNIHPYQDELTQQGLLEMLYELQEILSEVTGMDGVSLVPCAGAQGEFAGVQMIRAYHIANNEAHRNEIIVPDAAHGTNPATAVMAGCKVIEIPTSLKTGDIDIEALKKVLGPNTAGIMLTNPSTMGVFERDIEQVAKLVHEAGGLLYYDGANLNAIMGKAKPGKMGFDVMHMNVHKTFATPHGGGGPGGGPIAVNKRLLPYLPVPTIVKEGDIYRIKGKEAIPQTIGAMHAFMGNVGVLIRAYVYLKTLGGNGLTKASEIATLNANYMMARLKLAGFTIALPNRRASHEFIVSLAPEKKAYGVNANDFAKQLLDHDMHAPTMYFPLLVPECLLIEPTETETREQMDQFVNAMIEIRELARTNPEKMKQAPLTQPVKRVDDVKAVRELDVVFGQCC
ncbi:MULTISPECIES: aminomethyl-transferring glycine dehydrogenase subunit GcvPB [Cysteiniphilum]|uniref:glycine dehydrogenase (aminomethyl-transferring) n=1 Tax=Cysteiniphilum litorale TaxID=2056700 RepID=A0A8J2Z495_9GAMM|nr:MULTISPECIES: aminomethyl-transferring glycine dehydrogenase subunit GcvPB [Cysteiniphilum]GGF95171.1 glycine dehydrogenase (aminomethyl-transferring) [Cysteiniphilum litorale]